MTKRIILHATDTPANQSLSLADIEELNSDDMSHDPMPYHYVINTDGRILKGKPDRQLCGHCGRFSRDSISVAYVGGMIPAAEGDEPGEYLNTLNPTQESALRLLLDNLHKRHPYATITGANSLLFPDTDPTFTEPYFDVPQWWQPQK